MPLTFIVHIFYTKMEPMLEYDGFFERLIPSSPGFHLRDTTDAAHRFTSVHDPIYVELSELVHKIGYRIEKEYI